MTSLYINLRKLEIIKETFWENISSIRNHNAYSYNIPNINTKAKLSTKTFIIPLKKRYWKGCVRLHNAGIDVKYFLFTLGPIERKLRMSDVLRRCD